MAARSSRSPVERQVKVFVILAALFSVVTIASGTAGWKKLFYASLVLLLVSPYIAWALVSLRDQR